MLAAAGTPAIPSAQHCLEILAGDPATGQMLLLNTLTRKALCASWMEQFCTVKARVPAAPGPFRPRAVCFMQLKKASCCEQPSQTSPGGQRARYMNRVRIARSGVCTRAFSPVQGVAALICVCFWRLRPGGDQLVVCPLPEPSDTAA